VELVLEDVGAGSEKAWTKYYHLTNPKEGNWEALVPVVQEYYSRSDSKSEGLKVVSFEEWFRKLEESGKDPNVDVSKNPGLKLLEFFRRIAQVGADKRNETSLPPVGIEDRVNTNALSSIFNF